MSAPANSALLGFARSSARSGGVHLDPVTIALVLGIVLLGLVMVTSASVSIASQESGQPFYYLERQLLLTVIGAALALLMFSIRTELLERISVALLAVAIVLLVVVLIPGLGHAVNGSRRWLRLAGVNFQVSELARVLVLVYLASYAVRRETQLRESLAGLGKPLALLCGVSALLLLEPDFGAATVLFATGFALLFLAGARLRHVIVMTAIAAGGFAVLAVSASYRLRRLTAFLDPWADPYNSGFQLTQSLIAIGRGQWFGVGLGDSVQKLFYLPEAHTDFLFAVLAEELGLLGVLLTLGLFLALVWRSFYIARHAAEAGLKFAGPTSRRDLASGWAFRPSSTWVSTWACCSTKGLIAAVDELRPLEFPDRRAARLGGDWSLRVHHEAHAAQQRAARPR